MLGVGVCLPIYGYYAQAGALAGFPWPLFYVLLPTQLACAIATSWPDEPSDRRSEKRTMTVSLGQRGAQRAVIALHVLALALWPAAA